MPDELRVVVPGSDTLLGPTKDALVEHVTEYSRGLLREAERLEAMHRNGAGPVQLTVSHVRDASFAVRNNLTPSKKDGVAITLWSVASVTGISTGWFANQTDHPWGIAGFGLSAIVTAVSGLLGYLR
ncbi:hypothetical protein [Streptomyces erythrochromogenes]|uniref:hypothetical protein n=1 Tax=Streptomyces erythrochromogenes TaxID=285574 RepID=UPI0036A14A6B